MKKKCNNCNKISFNHYICDHCKYPMNYDKPSEQKGQTYKTEFPKLSIPSISIPNISFNQIKEISLKNSLLILAGGMITISISYLAYSKYRENQFSNELMQSTFGVKDTDEFIKMQKDMQKKISDSFKNINESIKKSFKND